MKYHTPAYAHVICYFHAKIFAFGSLLVWILGSDT